MLLLANMDMRGEGQGRRRWKKREDDREEAREEQGGVVA